ncbi:MAG: hypothetical protein AB7H80_01790 [Candidatus Kapaibacterium sp.]
MSNTIQPNLSAIREFLFADLPLAEWKPRDGIAAEVEPWASFERANEALTEGNREEAVEALKGVALSVEFESRQILQAWHALRELGVQPPAESATRVYGVVLEVHLNEGLDILAAYADHSARYLNYSGKLIVWEGANAVVDSYIDELLQTSQAIMEYIGPWEGERPAPPPKNSARINILTPLGLHFGEGELNTLSADQKGGPIIGAGARLMGQLIRSAQEGG